MNIADKVTMLVSDTMKPSKINFNIHVTSKSNMAANMAANMAPEHIRFIHKNSNNDI
jgi:hypothetical protein